MAPQQRAQLPSPPASFTARKHKILQQLSVPDAEYTDASPKGSVDVGIRELIGELNELDGFVTTSSCAGRVSVFLEGKRKESSSAQEGGEAKDGSTEGEDAAGAAFATIAGPGGKGGGGTWLFVSHDPIPGPHDEDDRLLRLLGLVDEAEGRKAGPGEAGSTQSGRRRRRLIHFKFEPMILHVLTASPSHAQLLLKCALAAGFRESGALNLLPAASSADDQQPSVTPIVGVRTMGLGLESLVGYVDDSNDTRHCTVSADYLRTLVDIANERFVENAARIARFRAALQDAVAGPPARLGEGGAEWEDAAVRRERKRAEGLRRKEEKMLAAREKETQRASEGLVDDAVDLPEYQLHGL
ncbi:tRNA wybutosine-synthesizing protein 3 [Colletotrichum gloeosporioides]|uniref:tRNA(Phe) 7-[(3-amino-3-carboxypropyl)-4-demethylwyosine(37)-N(4)]-methyltransferase n=1 Tax=Colletotrichum gloeosporioides TaxID=474922 RepID=A0A8H4CNL1_COLGL|nr:tRNA wybutosine-synthesizing protein 3 [Colletotrichum gloeosporioides]KAF3807206.1 tRNA wybutosine-synthesizing protein 3 [Colletotrichum gloeosporioides]